MAEVIPDFATRFDIVDPSPALRHAPLIVSAKDDWASADAEQIVAQVRAAGAGDQLDHLHFTGNHPLTQARFDAIATWVLRQHRVMSIGQMQKAGQFENGDIGK